MLETLAQAVVNGLLIGGIYALVSIGVTLIFGVVKIVNFAQGEFVMIGMYISFFLATRYGIDPLLSLAVSMPVLFIIGVLLQHFLIRRVLGLGDMPQIFLTFALSLLLDEPRLAVVHRQLPDRANVVFGLGALSRSALYPGGKTHRLRAGDGAQRHSLGLPAQHGHGQGHARRGAKA